MKKRIIALIMAVCMLVALTAGCGKKEKVADGVTEVSFFAAAGGKVFLEDDPVIAEIEKKTNTKVTMNLVNAGTILSDFSILVASGDVPDVSQLVAFDYYQFVDQGIFLELDELVEKYGQNIKKAVGEEQAHCWDVLRTDGKLYAIPKLTSAGKYILTAREDWMKKLGIETPQTLDAYVDMVRRFTTDDPDGNGKNDTYGISYAGAGNNSAYMWMFSPIFGAYGFQPQQYMIKGDKVVPTSVSDEYKEAVELITQLYKEKVIDQEIFIQKEDQARQKLVNSKSGAFLGWWSMVPNILLDQWKMNDVNPDAKWVILPAPKGADGQQGYISQPEIQCTVSIARNTKNPEAVMKLLDYLASDEGYSLATKGIEGVHYDPETGAVTEEGQKASTEKWLGALGMILSNVSVQEADWEKNTPDKWVYIKAAKDMPLYQSDMYSIVTDEYNTIYPEIKKIEEEWFIKFVTGEKSLDDYDEYVKAWEKKGGLEMLESMVKEYNARNKTSLKAALK